MFFDKELCLFQQKPGSQSELFNTMYQKLYQSGCVKENYIEGIIERESEYPTGLEINGVGFAIPHTDSQLVNTSQICFASLAEPVIFQDMVDKSHNIEVSIVFMLAMESPHEQVENLQNLMALFQEKEQVEKLNKCTKTEDFLEIIKAAGIS